MVNRNIAKALGMAEPERATYTVGDREVEVELPAPPTASEVAAAPALPDMSEDDGRIRDGDRHIDDIIREGMTAVRETLEEAGDMEPRSKSRAREVGAQLMAVTLNAIRHKQEFAVRNKQQSLKEAAFGRASITTVSNTQINNITASRNDIIRMARQAKPGPSEDSGEG